MLIHRKVVAPTARFVGARAEQMPFASGSFDLITAAGSLNYVNLDLFLPEVARVLTADGLLVIYDFSEGRRARGDERLEAWFDRFERLHPWPTGYKEFSLDEVDFDRFGLRLDSLDEFEVLLPMNLVAFVRYALSDVNVDHAIADGAAESEIHEWCQTTLADVFGTSDIDVVFEGYAACVRPAQASL